MQPSVPDRAPLDPTLLHAIRRHGRIWRVFATQGFNREMQFRGHFVMTIVVGVLQLGLALVPVLLLYGFTDEVRGWSRSESIALVGMFQLMFGVLSLAIEPNALGFAGYIREGELDMVVVRPMSSQFYVMTRWLQPAEVFSVLSGIAVLLLGLEDNGWPTAGGVVQMLVLLACGITMLACVWSATSWLAFWMTSADPLPALALDVMQAGRYPVSFFPVAVRVIFVGLIPIAFATTFPVEALLGRGNWWMTSAGVGLTAAMLVLLRAYWRFAIRFYTSASS